MITLLFVLLDALLFCERFGVEEQNQRQDHVAQHAN